jgi:hypothetical protein
MRTHHLSALCAVVLVLTATGALPAQAPVGVSPGSSGSFSSTTERCPTFSWGAVDGAAGFEVLVFDMGNYAFDAAAISSLTPRLSDTPALRMEIPGSATSWTPAREYCLSPSGRYAWVVGAVTDQGTAWSVPRLFRVEGDELAPTEMEKMVEKVVERLVAEGRLPELRSLVVGHREVPAAGPEPTPGAVDAAAVSATGAAAIRGELAQTTAEVYGVHGVTNSEGTGAAGLLGEATSASGDTAGVRGINQSTDGTAGVFENPAGGALLKGLGPGGEALLVDGTGAVTASAFILSCDSAGTFYRDADDDTFGDPTRNAQACVAPTGYVSDSTDCDDEEAAINPGAAEAEGTAACSDGLDNDCDDLVDANDQDCCPASFNTFYRDADLDGFGTPFETLNICTEIPPEGYAANDLDCNDEDDSINPDAAETCDGTDNDCEPTTPDGSDEPQFNQACDGADADLCEEGFFSCNGVSLVCTDTSGGNVEVCDSLDNDCDGAVDEGNPGGGGACNTGLAGVCAAGTAVCTGGSLVCEPNVAPSPETCDGLDNDCDGTVDEGNPGGGGACTTGLPGVCSPGTLVCTGGSLLCEQIITPSPEACDGLDNDCDGTVDEGNPDGGDACNTGFPGVCAAGTEVCTGGSLVCDQNVAPSSEACDGLDNDCDGSTDEGNPGGGDTCNTGLEGVCAAGTAVCTGGSLLCEQSVASSPETCDGLDNDCDGIVDDGGDTLCNDSNGCTTDACTAGECSYSAVSCNDGLICTADVCTSTGDSSFDCSNTTSGSDAVCGGQCVDTETDRNNCGDCGVSCPDTSECAIGECSGAQCSTVILAAGTPCTGGECDGQGNCVGG